MPSTQCVCRRASTGDSRSPRPLPRATPPSRLDGPSLPSGAATTAPPPVTRPGPPDVDQLTSSILRHGGAGQTGEVRDRELLAPRARVDARRAQPRLGGRGAAGPAGQGRPQTLAPRGEGRVDD